MKEQLISFETAKLAKEKGLPQDNFYFEDYEARVPFYGLDNELNKGDEDRFGQCKSISQSLLQKWLREKYDIEINITRMPPEAIKSSFNKGNKRIKKYNMWVWSLNGNPRIENPSLFFDNYEEAFEIGLQEALKLIKSYEKI